MTQEYCIKNPENGATIHGESLPGSRTRLYPRPDNVCPARFQCVPSPWDYPMQSGFLFLNRVFIALMP